MKTINSTLADKVAVVTGAAQGIGRAMAEPLAANGASVTLADVKIEAIEQVAAIRERGGKAIAVAADVSRANHVGQMVARVVATFGTVDILVNCPGATDTPMTRMGARNPEHFEALGKAIPLGRWAEPEEQANAVLFLVSEAASFITGIIHDVNGGLMMV
jgi:NAD(P)-dependent dehydrogenase (short-subunit alcohol dehydrogenase family)